MNEKEARDIIKHPNPNDTCEYRCAKIYLEALDKARGLEEALESVCNELGVPDNLYPAPIANAVKIAKESLAKFQKQI